MAKVVGEVKVSVEKVIHDSLRNLIQGVFDEHGVMVKNVSISWFDFSTRNSEVKEISQVELVTSTR